MRFDCIIANPPYAKIGCDITRKVIENNPDSNYAMLGTRSMFRPFYADILACQFVQIGQYELGTNKKLDWGVEQAILLATNGWTEVVDNRKKEGDYKAGAPEAIARQAWNHRTRSSHLVGVDRPRIDHTGSMGRSRTATLVQVNKSGPYPGGAMDGHMANVTDTKPTDVKLRNGYIYVSFETFEEACECAIDIISWKNPTDSHYRCVRWGFVCGLVPHYKNGF
jgi:hypothetical protein